MAKFKHKDNCPSIIICFLFLCLIILIIFNLFISSHNSLKRFLNYTPSDWNNHASIDKSDICIQPFNTVNSFTLNMVSVKLCTGDSEGDPSSYVNLSIWSTNSSRLPYQLLAVNDSMNLTQAETCTPELEGTWFNITLPEILIKANITYAISIENLGNPNGAFGWMENLVLNSYSDSRSYSDTNSSKKQWVSRETGRGERIFLFEIWGKNAKHN